MVKDALFVTTLLFLALGLGVLQECSFLIPYRQFLIQSYASTIGLFASALFLNLFAAIYMIGRQLFLKDTGRKLAHIEKQLRTGASISQELSERLDE
jgi:hypothetical protein